MPAANKYTTFHFRILDRVFFSWYGWLGILCILCGAIFGGVEIIEWTILEGHMRAFFLSFVCAAILLTVLSILELRYVLKHRPSLIVDLKLAAEISAGLGIFAFVVQFAQIGSTLDHLSPTDRSKQLQVISADMHIVLKCGQTPPPNPEACAKAENNLLRLEMYILTRSEHDVESVSNELKAQVQHLKNPANELSVIRDGLNSISRTDDVVAKILFIMPILTLAFASFAIAAKIALALHDKCKSVPPSQPGKNAEHGKESEIAPSSIFTSAVPVNPQVENPAIFVVAFAVTAVVAAVIVSKATQAISELRRSD